MSWRVNMWTMRSRKILAALGVFLAAAPMAGALLALEIHTRAQATRQVTEIAEDTLAFAENVVSNGLSALTSLTRSGISECDAAAVDVMRHAIYAEFAVKEIGITEPDGRITCSHLGEEIAVRVVSPDAIQVAPDISATVVELGTTIRAGLMLLWTPPEPEHPALSVTVPGDALTNASAPRFIRETGNGRMWMADGTPVGALSSLGTPIAHAVEGDIASVRIASERFPLVVEFAVPMEMFRAENGNLFADAIGGGALIGLLFLGLSLYILKSPQSAVSRLRDAAAREEFIPYYQPVVDVGTSRMVGCEVLMRWRQQDGSIATPVDFIALAEESGLANEMTVSLMRQVSADLGDAFGPRPWLKIGINLFDAHFDTDSTARDIQTLFAGSGIDFAQLMFELTERQPLRDIERARGVIRQIQSLGAKVALDDAGTGHSGLAHLQQLGVDAVKIDKLFIDTIGVGNHVAPIVDSLIRLGHDLGMEVIAEGVETAEQLEYLSARGADSAQGYLFSPPLPAKAFLALVHAVAPLHDSAPEQPRAAAVDRAARRAG